MARPPWITDFLIVTVFAGILAVLSVVNIRTLHQTYEQNERLQNVNQFLVCLDPTTPCGQKVAETQAAEREWLTDTMKSQAICTLLASRAAREATGVVPLEQVYNDCVAARAKPQPKPPESPITDEDEKK